MSDFWKVKIRCVISRKVVYAIKVARISSTNKIINIWLNELDGTEQNNTMRILYELPLDKMATIS